MPCSASSHSYERSWIPCRQSNRIRVPKPWQGVCCAASISTAIGQRQQPFGGAIVTKLAGSAKLLKGEHHIVPLLGPGKGAVHPELPFGAALECFNKSSLDDANVHVFLSPQADGRSVCNVPCAMTDGAEPSSRTLDVLYVLSGAGIVVTADGSVRRLHAGDSLIAWHNTTKLRPLSSSDEPPAVLKFHFPASVLMLPPGAAAAPSPSHTDLQVLVNCCQGDYDGVMSQQEATDMLNGVQQRASRAVAHLDNSHTNPAPQPAIAENKTANKSTANSAGADTRGLYGSLTPLLEQTATRTPPSAALKDSLAVVPRFLNRLLRLMSAAVPLPGRQPAVGVSQLRRSVRSQKQKAADRSPEVATSSSYSSAAAAAATAMQKQQQQTELTGTGVCSGLSAPVQRNSSAHPPSSGCVLLQRTLEEFKTFRFPRQTNKLAFVFDPSELGLSLSFGVEVFEPGHRTPLHIHQSAHELFFVLAGEGVAFCNGQRFPVRAGDCVVFPPRAVHGIDNSTSSKLYCLQLMTPNEAFVEHVKSGEAVGRLDDEDLCNLTSRHC